MNKLSFIKWHIIVPILDIWYTIVGKLIGKYLLSHHDKNCIVYVALIKLGGLNKHVNTLACNQSCDVYIFMSNNLVKKNFITFRVSNPIDVSIQLINPSVIHLHQINADISMFTSIASTWPTIVTIHDYYYVCPRFFLVDIDGNYCHPKNTCTVDSTWRYNMSKLLHIVDCIVCPNVSVKQMLVYYFPFIKSKCVIIPHGEVI